MKASYVQPPERKPPILKHAILVFCNATVSYRCEYANEMGINLPDKRKTPPTVQGLPYSDLRMRLSPGLTLCAHSVQLPSYNLLCSVGKPASVKAASMTAAVTPVPQLAIMGFEGSMFLDLKTSCSFSAGRSVLLSASRRSETGTEYE